MEEIGIAGMDFRWIGHFHRTRGDGWPRTGGQTGETGRGGRVFGEQNVEGRKSRSRGGQSVRIGWRLFSAPTSISSSVFSTRSFAFSSLLDARVCGSRFVIEGTGIG